jgi:hypothetical protein
MTCIQSSSSSSNEGLRIAMPALFTSTSIAPSAPMAAKLRSMAST